MRTITVSILVFLLGFAASMASAAVPSINVCVSDNTGKVVFKGVTHPNTPFVTGTLTAGDYVVQLRSNSATWRGDQYLLVVSAGQTKVVASSVAAEKFGQGGVALRVKVAAGLQIMGQIVRTSARGSDLALEKVQTWQGRSGEGGPRNHFAGRESLMVGQTGRGY